MQLRINSYVSILDKHVIRALADADDYTLSQLGLAKVADYQMVVRRPPPDEVYQTPIVEHMIVAAARGDIGGFVEQTARLLDEQGVFIRTDRLLDPVRPGASR